MPTQSIRLEFTYGHLYAIWFPIGILLSVAIAVSAQHGYIPDPLSFLNGTLLDLNSKQEDWLSTSIKTGLIAILILSIIAMYIRSTRITGLYISEETIIVHKLQTTQKYATASISNLQYSPTPNGDFKTSFNVPGSALSFTIGSYQREKLDAMLAKANATEESKIDVEEDSELEAYESDHEDGEIESADQILLKTIAKSDEEKPSYQKVLFLLLTLGAFMAAGGYRWGLSYTILIIAALFVHELGHVLAMKVFKYKNVSMLFLPFLGAAATGTPQKLNATKNALVSIAGPALGVLFAATCSILFVFSPHEYLYKFVVVSYFLNGFNLIPFKPLDGGHYLNAVLFSRFPTAQLLFDLVAVAGIGYIAFQFESFIFGAIALFTLFGTPQRFSLAKLAKQLRSDEQLSSSELDAAAVSIIRKRLTETLPAMNGDTEKHQKLLSKSIQNLWNETKMEHPKVFVSVLLFLLYLVTLPSIYFLFAFAQALNQALSS